MFKKIILCCSSCQYRSINERSHFVIPWRSYIKKVDIRLVGMLLKAEKILRIYLVTTKVANTYDIYRERDGGYIKIHDFYVCFELKQIGLVEKVVRVLIYSIRNDDYINICIFNVFKIVLYL